MTTTNGWPGKPGVPLNPEQDGWHWLSAMYYDDPIGPPVACFWEAKLERWPRLQDKPGNYPVSRGFCYLNPCLTPEEAAALQARADRNAAGFARVDAEAERAKFLHKQEIAALQARVAELEDVLRAKVTEIERAYSHEGHCIECHGAVRAWGNTEHRDDCWYVKARAALGGKDE